MSKRAQLEDLSSNSQVSALRRAFVTLQHQRLSIQKTSGTGHGAVDQYRRRNGSNPLSPTLSYCDEAIQHYCTVRTTPKDPKRAGSRRDRVEEVHAELTRTLK